MSCILKGYGCTQKSVLNIVNDTANIVNDDINIVNDEINIVNDEKNIVNDNEAKLNAYARARKKEIQIQI